jgi:sugar phosphate isomerase/epimerase
VTLFSYTREYFLGVLSLEDCLREAGTLEGRALELVGAQSLRGYPRLLPEVERSTRERMERFDLDPVSYGAYLERGRRAGQVAALEDVAEMILAELAIARRLGFRILRLNTAMPELVTRLLPAVERAGMTLAIELHQKTIESPEMQALATLFDRLDSPHVGFLQDLGAMMVRLPVSFLDEARRSGIPADIIAAVNEGWAHGAALEATLQRVRELGGNPGAQAWTAATHVMFLRTSPDTLPLVLPYLVHVHGKFFGLDADGEEPCIPYPEILGVLREGGYTGAIASEYLTWTPLSQLDAITQVAAHHRMVRRHWGATPVAVTATTTQTGEMTC